MDSIQTNSHKQDNYILKSNLWKFFKTLRAQANPIYCLLVASPISYAWITIIDKSDPTIQKRISIAQFINSLKKMPSTGKYYRLSIHTYDLDLSSKQTVEASLLDDLSLEATIIRLPDIVAYHCAEAHSRGKRFELTPQIKSHYQIKARYIDALHAIVAQCNQSLMKTSKQETAINY